MIESRAVLLVLLAILLSGFASTAFGRFDLGTLLILIGVAGYFVFNRRA